MLIWWPLKLEKLISIRSLGRRVVVDARWQLLRLSRRTGLAGSIPAFVRCFTRFKIFHTSWNWIHCKAIVQKIELNQLIHSFRFLPSRYAMSCCRNGDVQSVRSPTTEARFVFEKKENPTRVTKMKKKNLEPKKKFSDERKFRSKTKKKFLAKKSRLVSFRVVSRT